MSVCHITHHGNRVRVSLGYRQGDQRVAKEKARRRAAIMTRLEEENSVLQVLADPDRLYILTLPSSHP